MDWMRTLINVVSIERVWRFGNLVLDFVVCRASLAYWFNCLFDLF